MTGHWYWARYWAFTVVLIAFIILAAHFDWFGVDWWKT